jgi:hypothetical protein
MALFLRLRDHSCLSPCFHVPAWWYAAIILILCGKLFRGRLYEDSCVCCHNKIHFARLEIELLSRTRVVVGEATAGL